MAPAMEPQRARPAKARLSSVANSIRLLSSFSGEEDELGITTRDELIAYIDTLDAELDELEAVTERQG